MTKDRALQVLDVYASVNGSGRCTQDEFEEAKKMAIEALSNSKIPNNSDSISRQATIRFIRDKVSLSLFMKRSVDKADKACMELCEMLDRELPSAQPEDYTELKREFLRMASYIDVLLECSDEQKETLMGFISRLAEFMPWTEKD